MSRPIREVAQHTYLGLTLAVFIGVCVYAGYRVDGWLDVSPWGTLIGLIVGVVGGLTYFVLQIIKLAQGGARRDEADDS